MSEFRREKAVLSLAVARKCEFVTSDTSRPVQVLMSEQAEQSARLMQHVLLIAAGMTCARSLQLPTATGLSMICCSIDPDTQLHAGDDLPLRSDFGHGRHTPQPGGQASHLPPHRPALHEYMSPEQLLQQLEEYESRRRQKDRRPDWLKALIEQVAELFDPLSDVARAGYDCRLDEHGWLVRMYLGTSEIIGGPKDGQIEHASFRLDINRLLTVFESVERLEWYSVSNADREEFDGEIHSLLSLTATAEAGHRIHLELLGSPPRYVPSGVHLTDSGATIS